MSHRPVREYRTKPSITIGDWLMVAIVGFALALTVVTWWFE